MRGRVKQMLLVLLGETHAPLVVKSYSVILDQTVCGSYMKDNGVEDTFVHFSRRYNTVLKSVFAFYIDKIAPIG